jgi:hypothetical protein
MRVRKFKSETDEGTIHDPVQQSSTSWVLSVSMCLAQPGIESLIVVGLTVVHFDG